MKKIIKKISAMALIVIGLSVTLTGCGTEADSGKMRTATSMPSFLK